MTKTGGRDKNIDFWRILTKFAKFLLSDKREFFAAYLSQEALNFGWWKMAKFGICGKVFAKVCTFWQMKQEILLDCDQSNVLLACIIFFLYSFKSFFVPFGLY